MMIKLIVATHKEYQMPEDEMYLPVQVGAAIHDRLSYTGDNSGDNISDKNGYYCELTALYWAWKNLDADVLGLCHYRRYFRHPNNSGNILDEAALKDLLKSTSVILPKKRNYFIETGESQYVHAHGQESLDILRGVLADKYPEHLTAFDRTMSRTAGHRFNMMIMRREQFDAYCEWLFDVLFETENRMKDPQPRIMGFLSERLMDAWIETEHISYKELPVFMTEKVNWLKKGSEFLARKIKGRRM